MGSAIAMVTNIVSYIIQELTYLIKQEFFGIDNCHAIVNNSLIRKNANGRCLGSIAFKENCSLLRLNRDTHGACAAKWIQGVSPAWNALRLDANAPVKAALLNHPI